MTPGIDVSHYNGVINYRQVAEQYGFAICKASDGPTKDGNDPTYRRNYNGFTTAGMQVGAYHFARAGSAAANATAFLAAIAGTKPSIIGLDVEVPGIDYAYMQTWCTTVKNATGVTPHIYCNDTFRRTLKWGQIPRLYPLWLAKYQTDPPQSSPWNHVDIWQHTSTGKVPGISGNVDLNVMTTKGIVTMPTKTTNYRDAYADKPDVTLTPAEYDQKVYTYITMIARDTRTLVQNAKASK